MCVQYVQIQQVGAACIPAVLGLPFFAEQQLCCVENWDRSAQSLSPCVTEVCQGLCLYVHNKFLKLGQWLTAQCTLYISSCEEIGPSPFQADKWLLIYCCQEVKKNVNVQFDYDFRR